MEYIPLFSAFTAQVEAIITQSGYAFIFLATALEGIPLIGMIVPGHVAIIVGGFLAKIGILNLYWVLALAIIGAIVGDYIGFNIGRKYGMSFIDRLRPYFFIRDSHIEKAKKLLDKHTGKAMIIGRFSPVTRALMPFLVGTNNTPAGRFWLFNIIGGISWALVSVFIGYAFGSGYHAAAGYLGKFSVFVVIVAIIIIWGYRFVNIRFHIFKKYELFVLILNLLSLYTLTRAIQDAWAPESFMANFDVYVNLYMNTLNQARAWLVIVAEWVTNIGSTEVIIGLGILSVIWFIFHRKWRTAAIMALSVGGTGFALGVLKAFFLRDRPENALVSMVGDPSFPSGHAGMAAAFFIIVAYLLAYRIKSTFRRELTIVACVLVIVVIGLSRIILNVHWASDVIAGWSLGIFVATASILLVRYIGALLIRK